MNMRSVCYIMSAIIFTVFLSISACDSFLSKQPLDRISTDQFWNTPSDAELALIGVYSQLADNRYFGWGRVMLETLTDNAFYSSGGTFTEMSRGLITPSTGGVISSIWDGAYEGITACNYFLANIDRVEMDQSIKKRYIAEVRFLRAYFYWNLLFFYGGVPIYTEVPTLEEANIPRSSVSDVLDLVYKDLDFAINNLLDIPYTNGHAVKASAQGLKARVALYHDQYQVVVNLTRDIMDSGNFNLSDSYRGLFVPSGQDRNLEIIFSTRYMLPEVYTRMDRSISLFSQSVPRQDRVSSYECIDGLSIYESPLYNPDHPYENRDPRLDMSIALPGEVWILDDGTQYYPGGGATPPAVARHRHEKYVDKSKAPFDVGTRSEQDFVIFRYADILLMYAEAKNELSGPDLSIYDAINAIRARASVDMPPIVRGQTKAELRQTIRHERRVELAMEGLRYYDLKRWHIAHIIMPALEDPAGVPIIFEDPKHYLWPIPQSEMNVNPNLEQNPGYGPS